MTFLEEVNMTFTGSLLEAKPFQCLGKFIGEGGLWLVICYIKYKFKWEGRRESKVNQMREEEG